MSSHLIYILAISKECEGIPHEPWIEDMKTYQYSKHLQAKKPSQEFRRINDVFLGRLVFKLKGKEKCRLLEEATQVIDTYGYYYIQFP